MYTYHGLSINFVKRLDKNAKLNHRRTCKEILLVERYINVTCCIFIIRAIVDLYQEVLTAYVMHTETGKYMSER